MTNSMPAASTPSVTVAGLSFRYRDRPSPAIEGLSFDVPAGEVLLIAGASGCGKTTLIRCINGLIPRSYKGELQGQIALLGQDTAGLPLARISQMVGTVLQDPERQILGTRVLHEVAFGLENLGLPRDEIRERAERALEYLNIGGLRDRETFHLSGGEKQKVALAGVLAMRPRILILDEPLASLDPASAHETLDYVRQLADEGMTVLMVEHRVEDVLRIRPDRVLYMAEGRLRYLGVPGRWSRRSTTAGQAPRPQIVARAGVSRRRCVQLILQPARSAWRTDRALRARLARLRAGAAGAARRLARHPPRRHHRRPRPERRRQDDADQARHRAARRPTARADGRATRMR
jgi:energy-coupling factor transport system ATP-binding protein